MNDELRSLGSMRMRGILLLLAMAVTGGVVGSILTRQWGAIDAAWTRFRAPGMSSRVTANGENIQEHRARELARMQENADRIPESLRTVDLSEEQRARVRAITAKYRPTAESLAQNVRERVRALDLQMRQEAMCVLTSTQRDKWKAWRNGERLSIEESEEDMKLVTTNACPPR